MKFAIKIVNPRNQFLHKTIFSDIWCSVTGTPHWSASVQSSDLDSHQRTSWAAAEMNQVAELTPSL